MHNTGENTCVVDVLQESSITKEAKMEEILATFFGLFEVSFEAFKEHGFSTFLSRYYQTWMHR